MAQRPALDRSGTKIRSPEGDAVDHARSEVMTSHEGPLGLAIGAYITRRWGFRVIKCTICDWSARATSRPGYAEVLMYGHDSDHAAELAALKARNSAKAREVESDGDLAWLMFAESQYFLDHGQASGPDELDRLAWTAIDPVFLASVLAMIIAKLANDTAAKMQLVATAARAQAGEGDSEQEAALQDYHHDLAWQLVADWQQFPDGLGKEGPGRPRLVACTVTSQRYVAMVLAGFAAVVAEEPAADIRQKIQAGEARSVVEFLDAVRGTNLGFAEIPDSELIESGRKLCGTYYADGDAGLEQLLGNIYATRGTDGGDMLRSVAIAARQHLCP